MLTQFLTRTSTHNFPLQLVDCGFGQYGASGCNGAEPTAYLKWMKAKSVKLAHETQYPYKAAKKTCPKKLAHYNQGVEFSGYYITYRDGNL